MGDLGADHAVERRQELAVLRRNAQGLLLQLRAGVLEALEPHAAALRAPGAEAHGARAAGRAARHRRHHDLSGQHPAGVGGQDERPGRPLPVPAEAKHRRRPDRRVLEQPHPRHDRRHHRACEHDHGGAPRGQAVGPARRERHPLGGLVHELRGHHGREHPPPQRREVHGHAPGREPGPGAEGRDEAPPHLRGQALSSPSLQPRAATSCQQTALAAWLPHPARPGLGGRPGPC
mmetsp:Transcript_101770/g.247416  ORF Transcript_101770/g.247416 Transcript_101770/m.247416 type:complete len:233 (-) Transcript_101770:92-790(-)